MEHIKFTSLEGNRQKLDGGAMFGNVPREMWKKWHEPDSHGRIDLSCRCLLVESPVGNLLFETGIGAFFEPKLADRFGIMEKEHMLLENMERIGVSEKDIDYVILSHLHFDHAGGVLSPHIPGEESVLLFPNAKFIVGQEAWQRAKNPHFRDRASFIPQIIEKLESSGRLFLVEEGQCIKELDGLVEFRYSSGHTPGQMHSLIKGEKSVFFAGDLIPGTHWVHLPITMGYDRFPEKIIEEKSDLLTEAAKEEWFIFYTHDPQFAVSCVDRNEKGRFQAVEKVESITRMSL